MSDACEMISWLLPNDVEKALPTAHVFALSAFVEEQIIGVACDVKGPGNAAGRCIKHECLCRVAAPDE